MKAIKQTKTSQYKILKSNFLGFAFYVETEEEIQQHLDHLRKEYHDARHLCYGYVLNNPNLQKYNDDNEPAKSSGFQILNLLIKNEITNCLIAVIRYFGGIKLGIGKLSRSYLQCAKLLIEDNLEEFTLYKVEHITFSYSEIKLIDSLINKYKLIVINKIFSSNKVTYYIKFDDNFDFINNIKNKINS